MIAAADRLLRICEGHIADGDIDSARKCAAGVSILTGNPAWERAYEQIISGENPRQHITVLKVLIPNGLAELLHVMHDEFGKEHPHQSCRGGTQVNLTHDTDMRALIEEYSGGTPIGIWSTRLQSGGYHIPHIHPEGGRSAVLYIEVPDRTSGYIYFGVPRYVPMLIKHQFSPKTGALVSFPNWLWHGVTPYHGDKPRLTIAFDTEADHG